MTKDKWIWMPHAGHLIVGHMCRFRLNTYVGKYIVSTVGEYLPSESVREIMAQSRGIFLEGKGDARESDFLTKNGFEKIGYDRTYETMVFKAKKGIGVKCCPWIMATASELDVAGYQDADAAYQGHLKMCQKWSKK